MLALEFWKTKEFEPIQSAVAMPPSKLFDELHRVVHGLDSLPGQLAHEYVIIRRSVRLEHLSCAMSQLRCNMTFRLIHVQTTFDVPAFFLRVGPQLQWISQTISPRYLFTPSAHMYHCLLLA